MKLAAHPFSLRQLQYAVAVADALSFRKAAEACHVSQPSLSASLAQLEEAIGVQLFERDRRRVLATTAGREVIERARFVLQNADDLEESAARAGDPFAGTLRIGVIPTVSPYLLPAAAPALRAAYPRLTLLWAEDKTDALLQKLDSGALDAAIVARQAEFPDLEQEVLGTDAFVLATPITHPLAKTAAPARPADLRGEDVLLLDDGHCFREQALAFCSRAKARELEFRATSLSTLAQMVAAGAGITLLPRLAVEIEADRAGLSVRDFADPSPHRTLVLVWRRRSPLTSALHQLSLAIRKAYPVARTKRRRRPARDAMGK